MSPATSKPRYQTRRFQDRHTESYQKLLLFVRCVL